MPDASTVKVLVEHYGWPGLTVAVALFVLWRVMIKHEKQQQEFSGTLRAQAMTQAAHTEVNRGIATTLERLAVSVQSHDEREAARHAATLRSLRRD